MFERRRNPETRSQPQTGEPTMEPSERLVGTCTCCRRDFLQAIGAASAMAMVATERASAGEGGPAVAREKKTPLVRAAFLYPPTKTLEKEGYWSWPGSSFDA